MHAGAGGCDPNSIPGIVEEWSKDWGDSRAIASACIEYGITAVVFNQTDGMIEAVSAAQHPWQAPVWVMHFAKDHFAPMQPLDVDDMINLSNLLGFEPWTGGNTILKGGAQVGHGHHKAHVTHRDRGKGLPGDPIRVEKRSRILYTKGRRTLHARRARLRAWKPHTSGRQQDREESPVSCVKDTADDDLKVITWNIGSWATRWREVHSLLEDQKPHLLMLQEVRVPKERRAAIQAGLEQKGYGVLFGKDTPRKRVARGILRLDTAGVPGVMILYDLQYQVGPATLQYACG